jgi:hypothetical protein
MIPIWGRSDLPRDARCSKHSLGAGIYQSKERSLFGSLWPLSAYEGDVHHWPIDVSPRWMRFTTCRVFGIGKDPGEGTPFSQCRGLPESNQFGLVLLLCGDSEHTGVANPLGAQLLEERVRTTSRRDDLTAFEGHPLALEPAEYLG